MVWNIHNFNRTTIKTIRLQIISQNYVVWNLWLWKKRWHSVWCCRLYHKTTWFETYGFEKSDGTAYELQIISQNYVVWNIILSAGFVFIYSGLQIISQNYMVWNELEPPEPSPSPEVADYITKLRGLKPRAIAARTITAWAVANYITKLRGLKLGVKLKPAADFYCCKLYHKTTWFETQFGAQYGRL